MIIVSSGSGTVTNINTTAPLSGGPITTSGTITTSMATNKLIGRSTAGTGAMEEITIGTGLSLTGGTLSSTGGGAAGSTNQIQFNNAGTFAADSDLRWIISDDRLVLGQENTADTNSRMVVIGKGISTQNTFVVHNNTGTNNALVVRDDNFIGFGTATPLTISGGGTFNNIFRINNYFSLFSNGGVFLGEGASGRTRGSGGIGYRSIAIGYQADAQTVLNQSITEQALAIGASSVTYGGIVVGFGSQAGFAQTNASGQPIAIGNSLLINSNSGSGNIGIGTVTANRHSNSVLIGRGLTLTGNENSLGSHILLGRNMSINSNTTNNAVAIGFGNSSSIDISNSFQIYLAGQAERSFFLNSNGNIVLRNNQAIVSATNFDANATNTITINNGTAPATNIATSFQLYSANISGAGTAAPHFRNENGNVIKIYQETTGVASATFVQNSGNRVDEVSTFDGYTIAQVVKALRNQGLLA